MSRSAKEAQVAWIEKVQARLRITTSVLDDIKAAKMLGLSSVVSDTIHKLREIEMKTSKVYRKLLVWNVLLCKIPSPTDEAIDFAKCSQPSARKTYLRSPLLVSLS